MLTANSRLRLNIEELLLAKWLCGGLLSLLAVWTVFYVESTSGILALASSLIVVLTMAFPRLPSKVPSLFKSAIVPILVTVFAADLILGTVFLDALIRLSLLLLLFRACTYRTRREDLQLVVLSLFLIVVTGVVTVSLLFGVQILLFTMAAMLFLFIVTVAESGREGKDVPPEAWISQSPFKLLFRIARDLTWRSAAVGVGLLASLILIATILFTALPRVQLDNRLDFLGMNNMGGQTGFTDRMELSTVTNLQEDQTRVLRIEVDDPSVLPGTPYWRMVVMDEYSKGVFRESSALRLSQIAYSANRNWVPRRFRETSPRTEFRVYLEEGVGRYLPLTGSFERLVLGDRLDLRINPFTLAATLSQKPPRMVGLRVIGMDATGVIPEIRDRARLADLMDRGLLEEHDRTVFGYSILPTESFNTRTEAVPYPDTTLDLPLSVEDLELLDAWVAEITGGEELGPVDFAARAVAWLGNRHAYSMQSVVKSSLPEDRDIIVRWMEGRNDGHCEYFAAAFTLLGRAAGHPVRAVAGFKGGVWNRQDPERPYIAVRNSEAHAWCEIYTGDNLWQLVEPTPGGDSGVTRPDQNGAGQLGQESGMSAWLDSMRMAWYRRVISFDERSQQRLMVEMREASTNLVREFREKLEGWAESAREWLMAPWDVSRISRVAGLLVFLGALVVLAIVGWRKRLWLTAALDRRLRMDGVRREAARWLARLGSAEKRNPVVGGEANGELRLRLERLRWGPPSDRARCLAELAACRREVRRIERRR